MGKDKLSAKGWNQWLFVPRLERNCLPLDIANRDMLTYYAYELKFNTVEINYTYYRQPSARTLAAITRKVPQDFDFTIKAYKEMTHEIFDENWYIMLKHTFIHVPGVGPKTELKLWEGGIVSWEDYLTNSTPLGVGRQSRLNLDEYIERSLKALRGGDALFFQRLLPKREIWRIYPEFRDRIVFLDIETTGLGGQGDYITVIGLFDGKQIKTYIKGQNLEGFKAELENYSVIVTYNGKCFDIPFIESEFGGLEFTQAHIDLRYFLYRLGYSGGLKQVEVDVGIRREKGLEDIDGYLAAVLWQKYLEGDERALNALIRYNIEDIVNLKYLMEFGYNRMVQFFPITVDHLEAGEEIKIDVPFDVSIVREISDERSWTL